MQTMNYEPKKYEATLVPTLKYTLIVTANIRNTAPMMNIIVITAFRMPYLIKIRSLSDSLAAVTRSSDNIMPIRMHNIWVVIELKRKQLKQILYLSDWSKVYI